MLTVSPTVDWGGSIVLLKDGKETLSLYQLHLQFKMSSKQNGKEKGQAVLGGHIDELTVSHFEARVCLGFAAKEYKAGSR